MTSPHLVITSIAAPNQALGRWAAGAEAQGARFLLIGDTKSPPDFRLAGCEFYGIEAQRRLGLAFAAHCPERHYARKNIGYLLAVRAGAPLILESDDDNLPYDSFWDPRAVEADAPVLEAAGWVNAYRYFTEANIWPRGFPIERVSTPAPALDLMPVRTARCPIQQGLADDNPDVDAIYRMVLPLPIRFRPGRAVALGRGSWCPFNSQNTAWWPEAFPLLYLPAHCSFRMTDIWRSFVAQRIAWENGWAVLFHAPTVTQERNAHDLLKDFEDEVPGYLNNARIARLLEMVRLTGGAGRMGDDLRACYGALVEAGVLPAAELGLLEAWIADYERESGAKIGA